MGNLVHSESRQNMCGPFVCKRMGNANTFSIFGCERASSTESFTSTMAAVRIWGEVSSDGDIRLHRLEDATWVGLFVELVLGYGKLYVVWTRPGVHCKDRGGAQY